MGADEGEDGITARKALLAPLAHPRALPALFLAGAFAPAAGFDADVLAAGATGARALVAASDFGFAAAFLATALDRKSTRLNSSHLGISYAVFCLKKKKKQT